MATRSLGQPLLVTTAHRGVFFGYGEPGTEKTIKLNNARMCVSWSNAMQGVLGLAAKGPDAQCKISPAAPEAYLSDVTMVLAVTEDAAKKWESQPWG